MLQKQDQRIRRPNQSDVRQKRIIERRMVGSLEAEGRRVPALTQVKEPKAQRVAQGKGDLVREEDN